MMSTPRRADTRLVRRVLHRYSSRSLREGASSSASPGRGIGIQLMARRNCMSSSAVSGRRHSLKVRSGSSLTVCAERNSPHHLISFRKKTALWAATKGSCSSRRSKITNSRFKQSQASPPRSRCHPPSQIYLLSMYPCKTSPVVAWKYPAAISTPGGTRPGVSNPSGVITVDTSWTYSLSSTCY